MAGIRKGDFLQDCDQRSLRKLGCLTQGRSPTFSEYLSSCPQVVFLTTTSFIKTITETQKSVYILEDLEPASKLHIREGGKGPPFSFS